MEQGQYSKAPPAIEIIGSPVTALSFDMQVALILRWAQHRMSKYVCVANVHMLMEAFWDPKFHQILENADLVTPDGMPLVQMMQLLGAKSQNRVAGFDLFQTLCQNAFHCGVSIFLLGSDEQTLELMKKRLNTEYPQLKVAGLSPLPFREITAAENQSVINEINDSGAGLLFVALGCPKQEKWIASQRGKIYATMIGLGYVFEAYSGLKKRAPSWIQKSSLEWAFRLTQEPKRLWKRYFLTIPPFLILATLQLLSSKLSQVRSKINMKDIY